MQCNCVSGLHAESKAATEATRLGRLREGGVPKGHRVGEVKRFLNFLPDCLSQQTRENKVSQGLAMSGTEIAIYHCLRREPVDASSDGQRVKQEFVKRLLVPRSLSTVVEVLPMADCRFIKLLVSPRGGGHPTPPCD